MALTSGIGILALAATVLSNQRPHGQMYLSDRAIKCIILGAFLVNVVCVQIPGRLDGQVVKDWNEQDKRGKTYIAPAGWAFAIWGPIYLGEILFTACVLFMKLDGKAGETVKEMLPFWTSAHLFQSLWCGVFRPQFHTLSAQETLGPFVPVLALALTAISLCKASMVISSKRPGLTYAENALFIPIAMHFGWVTAATLVNLSGAATSYESIGSDQNLYMLGYASVVFANFASLAVAWKLKNMTFSLVIAWALFAVSGGMTARIENSVGGSRMGADIANAESIRDQSYYCGICTLLVGITTGLTAAWDHMARDKGPTPLSRR